MMAENLQKIQSLVNNACAKSHRTPSSIRIIAISKNRSIQQMQEALSAGISNFGENKIQEAEKKIPSISASWHFVGRLQSNKVKKAVRLFEYIHSIDSLQLAEKVNNASEQQGKIQKALLQINISSEETKAGFSELEIMQSFPQLLQLKSLSIQGLMSIAPLSNDSEASRPIFRQLFELREYMQNAYSHPLPELSMGMSQDYIVAVEEGATMLRIGTALFE